MRSEIFKVAKVTYTIIFKFYEEFCLVNDKLYTVIS
jgi:hypothetical protein